MSKKKLDILKDEQVKFIKQSINKGYTKEIAEKVYNLILKFANYGFNRAHAVPYSIIGYKMGYLKAHYPLYFMSNLLTSVIGNETKTKEYIYECKAQNIAILTPDINISTNTYQVLDNSLRLPLNAIKNIGSSATNLIIKEQPYQDFIDFVTKTYSVSVNKKTIESLIDANCFKSFNNSKQTLHYNLDNIISYAELVKTLDAKLIEKPNMVLQKEYSKDILMKQELEVFGFYLSTHPITKYRNEYKDIIDLKELNKYFNKDIKALVNIDNIKVIKTKKNEDMAFISGSDELNKIDITLFPKIYSNSTLEIGNIILVQGKLEKRLANYQLIANKIDIIK